MCDQFINKHLSNAVAKCLDYQKSDAFLRSHLPEPEHESADDLIEAILLITLLPYLKELHRVFAKKNKQFLIFFYNSNDILSLHDLVHFRYIFAWYYKNNISNILINLLLRPFLENSKTMYTSGGRKCKCCISKFTD